MLTAEELNAIYAVPVPEMQHILSLCGYGSAQQSVAVGGERSRAQNVDCHRWQKFSPRSLTEIQRLTPRSLAELQRAVDTCIKVSPIGNCSTGLIGNWDVSRVTGMNGVFSNAHSFNGDVSKWQVSRVTDMNSMFSDASSFNGELGKWEVSTVKDMSRMFRYATTFNGDIANWNILSVANADNMFLGAVSFKRKLCGAAWVHLKATRNRMFEGSFGSIPEEEEECTSPTTHTSMFSPDSRLELKTAVDACLKESPKGDWFDGPNGPIGLWDVSNVCVVNHLFSNAKYFNTDISKWDVSSVTDMSSMFFEASSFNNNVTRWDVSSVHDMSFMFSNAVNFNGDISKWNVSKVINMDFMFSLAISFKQRLCGPAWVNSNASKLRMFAGSSGSIPLSACASVFSPESLDELKNAVEACMKMPPDADCSNGPCISVFSPQSLLELKTAVVTCIRLSANGECLKGPHGPIGKWSIGGVADMRGIFSSAKTFNGDISKWDVSGASCMNYMFSRAKAFNGDISDWDVSNVEDMFFMFRGATSFNSDISKWDVSRVKDMASMFEEATSFNGDVSRWNVYSVESMDNMFLDAVSFKHKICGPAWIDSKARQNNMFAGSFGYISRTTCSPNKLSG